jgi:hypothetical protein
MDHSGLGGLLVYRRSGGGGKAATHWSYAHERLQPRKLIVSRSRERGGDEDSHQGIEHGVVVRNWPAKRKNGGDQRSSVAARVEDRAAKLGCQMEPGMDGGAHGVLYIGWGGKVRGRGGRVAAVIGFHCLRF